MSGVPEVEDIQNSTLYRAGDLEWIKNHPELIESQDVACVQTSRYAILYPDQGMQLNM